jgi:hypothetical protein
MIFKPKTRRPTSADFFPLPCNYAPNLATADTAHETMGLDDPQRNF